MNNLSLLNPPEPGTMESFVGEDTVVSSNTLSFGRQLMNLLRSLEKSLKHGLDVSEDELNRTLHLLTSMRDLFLRKGLLQGDTTKLEALASGDELKHSSSTGSKRKRRQGTSGVQYQVQISTAFDATSIGDGDNVLLNSSSSSSCDEILIMTSISRILNPSTSITKDSSEFSFPWVLTRAAVDVLTAICYGMRIWNYQIDSSENPIHLVECQILESFSSNLLNGLIKSIKSLMGFISDENHDTSVSSDEKQEIVSTLSSCFTCFTWIIVSLGTKLSRSTNIMMQIKILVNDLLWMDRLYGDSYSPDSNMHHALLNSICGLVSVLPMVGDSNSTSPNKIWNHFVQSIATSYQVLLQRFFPESSRKQQERTSAASTMTLNLNTSIAFEKEALLEWIALIPSHLPSQQQRLAAFSHRVHVYSCLLMKLLSFELYDTKAMVHFSTTSLPSVQLLDLCDLIINFSSNAERRYLNTKARLRDVTVEQGLFSVLSAVSIGNGMKYLGLDLFRTVISVMNQSCLMHGKRTLQTCLVSLKSCASTNVRNIVDPMYSDAILNLGKSDKIHHGKMKWLHTSIVLRTQAIQTLACVVEQLGSNVVFESNTLVLIINIIAGCLLEQILGPETVDDEDHWGTLSERVELVTCCLHVMSSITSVCGGFLPFTIRETIESISLSCMNHLRQFQNTPQVFSFASTKVAVLQLSLDCISCPWPDGCVSSLLGTLYAVANTMKHDRDERVSVAAYKAAAVCNALIIPRAPPLVIGVRNLSHDGDQKLPRGGIDSSIAAVSYESLISGIMSDMKQKMDSKVFTGGDVDTDTLLKSGACHGPKTEKSGNDHNEKIPSTEVQQSSTDDQVINVTAAAAASVNGSMSQSKAGIEYAFSGSANFNDSIMKSDKFNKFENQWAHSKGLKEKSSVDDDDEALPDIIDGDPDL